MSVRGWSPGKFVLNPRGMWSLVQQKREGHVYRASFMQNSRIAPGVVRSRPGLVAIPPQTNGKVPVIFNWITPHDADNLVMYQDGLTVKEFRQDDQTITSVIDVPSNTQACSFADLDVWLYICGYDSAGNGTFQARVYDGTNADLAFRMPITVSNVVSTVSSGGQCTAGVHYIGFVYMDRTGFAGVPTTTTTIPAAPPSSSYPGGTPPTFPVTEPPGTSPSTVLQRPAVYLNGWAANQHEGPYEMGVDQGVGWGLNADTTYWYNNPGGAVDGNASTAATADFAHTHKYAGCIYKFSSLAATPSDLYLNVYSAVPGSGSGRLRSSGVWYSLDGGATWTQLYNASTRAPQWDTVHLSTSQNCSQVQVMIFLDSHDDMSHSVSDIQLSTIAAGTPPPPADTPTSDVEWNYGSPVGGAPMYGSLTFSGWVGCTTNHVAGVLLYIDNHYIEQLTYGGERPEVAEQYPDLLNNPYTGFDGMYDISGLSAGAHSWNIVVVLADGRQQTLTPTANFTVSEGGTVPILAVAAYDHSIIDISVDVPALPDGGGNSKLYLIMTRADNPSNWYWMPTDDVANQIGSQPVPLNTATTLHFRANISDEDMVASLDSANDQFRLLTQSSIDGTGPFNPDYVVAYGQRMCYGNGTILYVSDINMPQQLAADRNAVTMPNQRKIGYAFPLPGSMSLFLTGDRWTAYVNDNSDIPSTWSQPILISQSLGSPTPNCVCFRTGSNHAWMVTEGGVYRFAGVFDDLPVTYMVFDQWARVNWKAAYTIQIVDNVPEKRVYVGVPFDGATDPNRTFVIDYTNGLQYDQVDISLDVFNPAPFASLGVVKEIANDQSNVWIGPIAPPAGTFCFTVGVRDGAGSVATVNCCINISTDAPPPPPPPPPPVGSPTSVTVFVKSSHIHNVSSDGTGFAAFSIGPAVVGGGARDFVYDTAAWTNRIDSVVLASTDDLATIEIWLRNFHTLNFTLPTDDPAKLYIFEVWAEATYSDGSVWYWRPQSSTVEVPDSAAGQVLNPLLAIDANQTTYAEIDRWRFASLADYNICSLMVTGFQLGTRKSP